MKALSLWQPWASAMANGFKQNETRSWATEYRGDLVICSAKRKLAVRDWELVAAVPRIDPKDMPLGVALCIVELFDIVRSERFLGPTPIPISETEAELGDYAPGRFVWRTRNCRKLKTPVPTTGRQSLWNLPESTVENILANLWLESE